MALAGGDFFFLSVRRLVTTLPSPYRNYIMLHLSNGCVSRRGITCNGKFNKLKKLRQTIAACNNTEDILEYLPP